MLSVQTKILYPVNPCSFVMIHGKELHQLHLIRGAPRGVNPFLIKLLGVCLYMGRIYALVKVSMVLCYTNGNELHQIHQITGAPHGVNPLVRCVSIHGEDLRISR